MENFRLDVEQSNLSNPNEKTYPFYIDDNIENAKFKYRNNTIKTTKYNAITFIPKALMYQFMRPANCYFLFTAILNCIPIISPLGSGIALVPIVFVLLVSLIRELIEDIMRARIDKEQNSDVIELYSEGKWIKAQSGTLQVGQIVKIYQDGIFPADLLILTSNLLEGLCYIETATLDGEKNLKIKQATLQTAVLLPDDNFEKIVGFSICDMPNPYLYHLIGRLKANIKSQLIEVPLDSKQLLLKGAKLRNTQWVIGIIAYAGNNCKIMKNSKKPRMKYSKTEHLMNIMIFIVLGFKIILCIISAILYKVYFNKNLKHNNFLNDLKTSLNTNCVLNFFSYVLLLYTMIPISLIITLEMVKILQVLLLLWDAEGYSITKYKSIKPNSVNLNEELGIVNYIFTDKTGTLTCNKMEFKYCVIGDVCYEYFNDNNYIQRIKEDITLISKKEGTTIPTQDMPRDCSYPNMDLDNFNTPPKTIINNSLNLTIEFWKALALCHDCTIETKEGKESYIGLSPDSIELVNAAKRQGYCFTESGKSSIRRLQIGSETENYIDFEILLHIEFNSERKRESIVVREENLIKLYIKGADNIIEERLSKNNSSAFLNQSKRYVDHFACHGFRTLFIGMKILDEKEWEEINKKLNEAKLDLSNKENRLNQLYEVIEKDIYLIGATIVEDKLQDLVPETIRDLKLAGIKIWMLTGDKMTTAFNISLSCNLLNNSIKTFFLEGKEIKRDNNLEIVNKDECEEVIIKFGKQFSKFAGESLNQKHPEFGIVIDEKALLTITNNSEMSQIFLNIAKDAQSVICCRVSPLQKSEVVKMMQQYDKSKTLLAVGDGGNDVSMIMEANIGIGIYGEEGLRAVQSSDYAIGEFKILRRLLMFHGRVNNIRICDMIIYFFYKNMLFTMNHFIFGFYNNFSGQTIIDDWFINMYSLLLTAFPIGARACMDFDIKPEDGIIIDKMLPFLYSENRENLNFGILKFCNSMLKSFIHAFINYIWTIYIFFDRPVNQNGDIADIWFMSVTLYTNVIMIVSIDLLFNTKYHTWVNVAVMLILTYLAYFIFLIIVHYWIFFNSVATMAVVFSSGNLWLNMVLICSSCALLNLIINFTEINFSKKISNYLAVLVNIHGKINNLKHVKNAKIKENLSLYIDNNDKVNENDIRESYKENFGNLSYVNDKT